MREEERTRQQASEFSKGWSEHPSLITDYFCMSVRVRSPWLDQEIPVDSNYKLLACVDTGFCTQKVKTLRVKLENLPHFIYRVLGWWWVGFVCLFVCSFERSTVKKLRAELRK